MNKRPDTEQPPATNPAYAAGKQGGLTLQRHSPGKWIIHGYGASPVYAVKIKRLGRGMPDVWELQNEDGSSAFGDAFEGLSSVRAWVESKNGK